MEAIVVGIAVFVIFWIGGHGLTLLIKQQREMDAAREAIRLDVLVALERIRRIKNRF